MPGVVRRISQVSCRSAICVMRVLRRGRLMSASTSRLVPTFRAPSGSRPEVHSTLHSEPSSTATLRPTAQAAVLPIFMVLPRPSCATHCLMMKTEKSSISLVVQQPTPTLSLMNGQNRLMSVRTSACWVASMPRLISDRSMSRFRACSGRRSSAPTSVTIVMATSSTPVLSAGQAETIP